MGKICLNVFTGNTLIHEFAKEFFWIVKRNVKLYKVNFMIVLHLVVKGRVCSHNRHKFFSFQSFFKSINVVLIEVSYLFA